MAAISYDTAGTLKHFSERRGISVPLLADPESQAIRAFGILNESAQPGTMAHGIPHPGIFVVDERGAITAKYFEDDYRERFTVGGILAAHFQESGAVAGSAVETEHLKLTTALSTAEVAQGQRFTIEMIVDMKPGMHVYAPGAPSDYITLDWRVAESPAWKVHAPVYPSSERMNLAGETVPVFHKRFRITRDVTITGDGKILRSVLPADRVLVIQGSLRYQACDDTKCFPPKTTAIEWRVKVSAVDSERAPVDLRRGAKKQP